MHIQGDTAIQQVLDAIKTAQGTPLPDAMKATYDQSGSPTSGLTNYDLEAGAKILYPVLTPLRNEIPRVSGRGGTQANWRAITAINTSGVRIGVSQGNRGGVIAVATADYSASYKGIGLEGSATYEADYAAEYFDDVKARAVQGTLQSTMIGEEFAILGGNGSLALGTAPTPSVTVTGTGGTLAATQYVRVVALTLDAYANGSVADGFDASITRTNADGSTDTFGGGSSQRSGAATATISSGTTNKISASVAPVMGAVAYAWYWGTTSGSEVLGAVTTAPVVEITAAAAGTQLSSVHTADNSVNGLIFDGLLTQAMKPNSNSYYANLLGQELTADGAGGIVEFDAALKHFWDNYRLSPDTAWISSQEAISLSQKMLDGKSNGAFRIVINPEQGGMMGGVMIATYLNRFGMGGSSTVKIRLHPNMPAGTILFTTKTLPYALNDVSNVMQVKTRREYYQVEWPRVTRKYEYGVYADEVLQHYFPPSMGVITGIGSPSS